MNRKWILPVLVALAAGALAFGIRRRASCGAAMGPMDRLQDVSFLVRELKLTGEQEKEIRALHAELGVTLNECCARHCAARMRLGSALADGTNGDAQAEAILSEMSRAYEQSERATLDHMRRMRALLDGEQRQRFDRMIQGCMGRTCSMPANATKNGQCH